MHNSLGGTVSCTKKRNGLGLPSTIHKRYLYDTVDFLCYLLSFAGKIGLITEAHFRKESGVLVFHNLFVTRLTVR